MHGRFPLVLDYINTFTETLAGHSMNGMTIETPAISPEWSKQRIDYVVRHARNGKMWSRYHNLNVELAAGDAPYPRRSVSAGTIRCIGHQP